MKSLLTRNIGSAIVQRALEIYCLILMKLWWMPLLLTIISVHRNDVTIEALSVFIFLFIGISILLSREEVVHHDQHKLASGNQSIIILGWFLICLALIAVLNLPYSFYELVHMRTMSIVTRIIVNACTLGVGANILLLWIYCALEYQKTTLSGYLSILVTSFLRALKLVLFHPLALLIFALNNLVTIMLHSGLVMIFDHIASAYPYTGSYLNFVLMGLRVWVPFVILAPWYTSLTAVVYEYITAKRDAHRTQE